MRKAIVLTVTLLGAGVPLLGQQQQQPDAQRQQRQQQRQTFGGHLSSITAMQLPGQDQPHLIARLHTEDGRTIPVDLGRRLDLSGMRQQVDVAQPFQVSGRVQRINDRQVLFADSVQVGQRSFQIDRSQQARQGQFQQLRAQQQQARQQQGQQQRRQQQTTDGIDETAPWSQEFQATVKDLRRVNLPGEGRHLLAWVETEPGVNTVVDLGRPQNLRELQLQQGDQIQFSGQLGNLNGEPVIYANDIIVNGQSVQIERPRRQQGQQRQQGRQQQQQREQQQQQQESQQARGGLREVKITATDFDFQPMSLVVRPGQRVRVRLVNEGNAPHNIEFELPSGEIEFEQPLQAGQSRALTFTAPQETGKYIFYCPVGNHRERGMEGTLIVRQQ